MSKQLEIEWASEVVRKVMSEQWQQAKTPSDYFAALVSPDNWLRKLRLLGCACAKVPKNWHKISKPVRSAVEMCYFYLEGDASDKQFEDACIDANDIDNRLGGFQSPHWLCVVLNMEAKHITKAIADCSGLDNSEVVALIKEVFDNPYEYPDVTIWQTQQVKALAERIYQNNEFELTPVLRDMLIDAGCEDKKVLSHCEARFEKGHVRGCWLLDLLLDKSGV